MMGLLGRLLIGLITILFLYTVWRVYRAIRLRDRTHIDVIEEVVEVSKIAAGLAAFGALLLAPTGIAGIGVALGLVSAPLIVTAAPVLAVLSTAGVFLISSAKWYSRQKRRKATEARRG